MSCYIVSGMLEAPLYLIYQHFLFNSYNSDYFILFVEFLYSQNKRFFTLTFNISSWFSSKYEAFTSDVLGNLKEICFLGTIYAVKSLIKLSATKSYVIRLFFGGGCHSESLKKRFEMTTPPKKWKWTLCIQHKGSIL